MFTIVALFFSSFWKQQGDEIDFERAMKKGMWCHATGITPMCGSGARAAWISHIKAAMAIGVPVTIDFNHRLQLGSLRRAMEYCSSDDLTGYNSAFDPFRQDSP